MCGRARHVRADRVMARERGVDPECLRLARHFLEDYAAEDTLLADLLGERVQGAVEGLARGVAVAGEAAPAALAGRAAVVRVTGRASATLPASLELEQVAQRASLRVVVRVRERAR